MNKTVSKFGDIPIAVTSVYPDTQSKAEIVLIHMSWGGAWIFTLYQKFFASHGITTHAVDLRGHGRSGGSVEGATMQAYVHDVAVAVEGLGITNPIVIGHSMGGLVALMYASQFPTTATVVLDGSPSIEVQQTSTEKTYPASYKPTDAGMPKNPLKVMEALKDISLWRMIAMKMRLGVESGVARSDRKHGISVPKSSIQSPLLFIGAENGTSLPFGIGIEKTKKQAEYYDAKLIEIKGASHPGLLIGDHWKEVCQHILNWLQTNDI